MARELLRAVEPMAIEAAHQAKSQYMQAQAERRRIRELDLRQARYEASLAERRYAACDPDNRLIAAQLEKSWEAALQRLRLCEEQLVALQHEQTSAKPPDFSGLAEDLGMPTGQGKTWTAHRVASLRRVRGVHAYRPAEKDGQWLTMSQAAAELGVTNHRIRRLIKDGLLRAEQVVPCAPYQIRADDLKDQKIIEAVARTSRPCRVDDGKQMPMFSST